MFGPIFRHSFVSFTLHPYNNLCASVFGFPVGSNFLHFVIQSARLNSAEEDFWSNSVPEQFGPTFFTSMFVSWTKQIIFWKMFPGSLQWF